MQESGQLEDVTGRRRWHAELAGLTRLADEACGLDVRSLRSGQTLLVRTHNSTYRLRLTDPGAAVAVAVGDGSFLTSPTTVTVVGATLTGRGTSITCGRVLVGFRLVICGPHGEIITSAVQAVSVDGMPWLVDYRHQ